MTAVNTAGNTAAVDYTVTVGTRFFKSLEVLALPYFVFGNNLRVEYGLVSAAPATYKRARARFNELREAQAQHAGPHPVTPLLETALQNWLLP